MKWLLWRLLVVCLLMGVFCSAAIIVGRLDPTPSNLQKLGIDICDGEPCYRGIKISTNWATVQNSFPNAVMNQGFLQIESMNGLPNILFQPSADSSLVDAIRITTDEHDPPLPFSVGDLIALYGPPCRIGMDDTIGIPIIDVIIYPKMILTFVSPYIVYPNRLEWEAHVTNLSIDIPPKIWGTCDGPISPNVGLWHGFTSAEAYRRYNLRDLAMARSRLNTP